MFNIMLIKVGYLFQSHHRTTLSLEPPPPFPTVAESSNANLACSIMICIHHVEKASSHLVSKNRPVSFPIKGLQEIYLL